MTENNTPKYRLYQNTGFMVSTAWRVRRSVIFLVMLLAVLAAANTAAQLFAAPMILRKVETLAPLPELLTVIGVFGAGLPVLSGLEAYVRQNALFGRIAVRQDIVLQLEHKAARTSYPNTMRADFQSFQEKSYRACYDNRSAAEGFWNTLTELLSNGLSFLLWVVLLSGLNPLLLCVIGVTCGAGYGLGRIVGGWGGGTAVRRGSATGKWPISAGQPQGGFTPRISGSSACGRGWSRCGTMVFSSTGSFLDSGRGFTWAGILGRQRWLSRGAALFFPIFCG